tara:strand:+ start:59 stop:538 length:480 start_codon:yes stop_codon:yes gene_type:complete
LNPENKFETNINRELRDFSRSLPMILLRTREIMMEKFRPNLRKYDLTDQQWRVLRALFDHGAKDLGELSDLCCILKPSITRIIRSMEKRDLVAKNADVSDNRRTIVSIMPRGEKLVVRIGPNSEKIYQEMTAAFGESELEDLYNKLDALEKKLGNREAT